MSVPSNLENMPTTPPSATLGADIHPGGGGVDELGPKEALMLEGPFKGLALCVIYVGSIVHFCILTLFCFSDKQVVLFKFF